MHIRHSLRLFQVLSQALSLSGTLIRSSSPPKTLTSRLSHSYPLSPLEPRSPFFSVCSALYDGDYLLRKGQKVVLRRHRRQRSLRSFRSTFFQLFLLLSLTLPGWPRIERITHLLSRIFFRLLPSVVFCRVIDQHTALSGLKSVCENLKRKPLKKILRNRKKNLNKT